MFIRRSARTLKRERGLEYELHPWIAEATSPGKAFFANPDRPRVFALVGGALCNIGHCTPPALQYGDLVWISFTVEFIVGTHAWNPNFTPVEIIRVGSVIPELVGVEGLTGDASPPRQRLQAGQTFALSTFCVKRLPCRP